MNATSPVCSFVTVMPATVGGNVALFLVGVPLFNLLLSKDVVQFLSTPGMGLQKGKFKIFVTKVKRFTFFCMRYLDYIVCKGIEGVLME